MAMVDFESRPPKISFAVNGDWHGVAQPLHGFKVGNSECALFPHVLSKNCRYTDVFLFLFFEQLHFVLCFLLCCSMIYVNGNGNKKITKNGNEKETEKFETETDKFGYVLFRFRCISVSRHHVRFM